MALKFVRRFGVVNAYTAFFVTLHLLEDATLISIGKFLPFPWWILYPLGLFMSAVIMRWMVNRLVKKEHQH